MAKIRLDMDQLSVETFDLLPDGERGGGTIRGHEFDDMLFESNGNPTCLASCVTCPGRPTCTCPATCNDTCWGTCPPCAVRATEADCTMDYDCTSFC